MTFLWREFVASAVKSPGQFDAGDYGVSQELVEGAVYRVVGVHHLDPSENAFKHNVYVCIVDKDGRRIPNAKFQWSRIGLEDHPYTIVCDKPDDEPWGNFVLDGIGVVATVWCADGVSDQVRGLSTAHPDEGDGNRLGHHSFLVVFQRGVTAPMPPPAPPVPPAGLEARVEAIERALAAAARALTL
jgi:hypothetical protein